MGGGASKARELEIRQKLEEAEKRATALRTQAEEMQSQLRSHQVTIDETRKELLSDEQEDSGTAAAAATGAAAAPAPVTPAAAEDAAQSEAAQQEGEGKDAEKAAAEAS